MNQIGFFFVFFGVFLLVLFCISLFVIIGSCFRVVCTCFINSGAGLASISETDKRITVCSQSYKGNLQLGCRASMAITQSMFFLP